MLLVVLLLLPAGCSHQAPKKTEPPPEQMVQAATFIVEPMPWPTVIRCQGSLIADETTTVSAKVAGRVETVHCEIGDRVKDGQILVEIDDKEYRLFAEQSDAQLTQARAAVGLKPGDPLEKLNPENAPPVREAKAILEEATKSLARFQTLTDAVSKTDLEVAEAAERVASARYTSAQNSVREKIALVSVQMALKGLAYQRLADTKVPSPFDGEIQSKTVAEGTYVQPGQALLTLVRTKELRFRASVPEKYAHQLKLGQRVDVAFDLSKQKRSGTVSRINPNLDPMSRSLGFEVDLDNSDGSLRSGLFGEATIELDPDAFGIAIPTKAILRFAGVDKVWKVVDGRVKEQVVLLGSSRQDRVEIRTGVNAGDRLLGEADKGRPGKLADPEKPDKDT